MVNEDGTGLEQITNQSIFNAFPMFSPDGKKLIFSSNRNNGGTRDTNLFIADSNLFDQKNKLIGRGSGSFMRSKIELTENIGYK